MVVAAFLFARRDIGAPFPLLGARGRDRAASRRDSVALLGSIFGKGLRDVAGPTMAWSLALALYSSLVVFITNEIVGPMQQIVRNSGWLGALMGEIASNEGFLAVALFINLPVLLAIFSITQIDNWASSEEEGRLGILLSLPLPRRRVLLASYGVIFASLLIILVITGASILLSAWVGGVALDGVRVWSSLFAAIPLVMLVSAFGLCVATWLPRPSAAMPLTIAIVAGMFLLEIFAPLFRWPEAIRNLSIFHFYGRPLVEGINWAGFSTLSIATLLFAALSLAGFTRRDLTK
jgi:ABC-2 type transport system permease protein